MTITITIPVRPYIKKYLMMNRYLERPFRVTAKDPVGIALLNLLESPPKHYAPNKKKPPECTIDVILGGNRKRCLRCYLSPDSVKAFNDYLDKMIKDEMYKYIEMMRTLDMTIDDGIELFHSLYEFTQEELTFESLRKSYYRYRKASEAIEAQALQKLVPKLSHK